VGSRISRQVHPQNISISSIDPIGKNHFTETSPAHRVAPVVANTPICDGSLYSTLNPIALFRHQTSSSYVIASRWRCVEGSLSEHFQPVPFRHVYDVREPLHHALCCAIWLDDERRQLANNPRSTKGKQAYPISRNCRSRRPPFVFLSTVQPPFPDFIEIPSCDAQPEELTSLAR
jgi:hypothetical protein